MLPRRALGLGLLLAILISSVAFGATVFKRDANETTIEGEDAVDDGEGVVEAYLEAKEKALIEIDEFLRDAEPGTKPDLDTEVMITLRYWREKLKAEGLPAEELAAMLMNDPGLEETGSSVQKRTIGSSESRRWTKGYVPYMFLDSVDPSYQNEIHRCMEVYHRFTCMRYVPWEDINGITTNDRLGLGHPGHLRFMAASGCWSYGGNLRKAAGQAISCCTGVTCMHELGHAMDQVHEQQSPNPDRNRYIRINRQNINDRFQMWYNQHGPGALSDGFDLSSFMHYAKWMGGNGNGPTFTILFPELSEHNSYYYMIREVSQAHKCQDECSDVSLVCENDGYLTTVDGRCTCRCVPGLDPDSGCTAIYKNDPPSLKFPGGNYALPAHSTGCPDDSFTISSRTQYTDGGNWKSENYDLKGSVTDNMVEQSYCVQSSADNGFRWPGSNLCVHRTGGSCPEGFTEGFAQFQNKPTDDQPNTESGDLPDGVFGENTRFEYCCQNLGFNNDELFLPSRKPFAVIRHRNQACQLVRGMHSKEISLKVVNAEKDGETVAEVGGDHPIQSTDSNTYKVDYCSYIPAVIDCGDVIELDASNPEASFSSPNQPELECYWLIKAPAGERLALDFTEFDIKGEPGQCVDDLEVRYSRPGQPGLKFCGRRYDKTTISINNTIHIRLSTYGDSNSHFSATVKLVQDDDLCYQASDYGMTYTGDVAVTRDYEPCLPWHEMTHCEANPFVTSILNTVLEGNKCRNPDQGAGFQPWCYTDKNQCRRNYCDVCLVGKPYDERDDCEELQSSGNCPPTGCAKTCFNAPSQPIKASEVSCPAPGDSPDGSLIEPAKSSYAVGESVTYKCNYLDSTRERFCLTSGQWTPMGSACTECPPGWRVNMEAGLCYKTFPPLKYGQAKEKCEEVSATLAMPKNAQQVEYLLSIMTRPIFLGITDSAEEGTFVFLDGEPVEYTSWHEGQPDNAKNREDCVYMDTSGKWDDTVCYWWSKSVICQKPAQVVKDCLDFSDKCDELFQLTPNMCGEFNEFAWKQCRYTCGLCSSDETPKCTVEPAGPNSALVDSKTELQRGESVTYSCEEGFDVMGGDAVRGCSASGEMTGSLLQCAKPCPDGWTFYEGNNYCYQIVDASVNFGAAKSACEESDATLLIIKSKEENDFIQEKKGRLRVWIGLTDQEEESVFKWVDGTPLTYANWHSGEPNNNGWRGEDCVLLLRDGTMYDANCVRRRFGYGCMKPAAVARK